MSTSDTCTKGGGKGEWIGYTGSSQTYVPITEEKLKILLMLAVLLLGGGAKLLGGLSRGEAVAGQRVARKVSGKGRVSQADWSNAHEAIARAAETRAMVGGARTGANKPQSPNQAVASGLRFGGLQPAAAGGFGRRGR